MAVVCCKCGSGVWWYWSVMYSNGASKNNDPVSGTQILSSHPDLFVVPAIVWQWCSKVLDCGC